MLLAGLTWKSAGVGLDVLSLDDDDDCVKVAMEVTITAHIEYIL